MAPGDDAHDPGAVMVIGGAEDKLKNRVILSRFIELAGGKGSVIAVLSTASGFGPEAIATYRSVFRELGAAEVIGLHPESRGEANSAEMVESLKKVTGVFMTGGNQMKLSTVVVGTLLGAAILEAHARGAVVAGTSAGASAASTHMIGFGRSGATPKHRMANVSVGLGLLVNVIVDQHFEQRTRLGRLLAIVAQSPSLIGLGLDEDTAAIVFADDTLEVVGRGAVTIIDGRHVVSDAFEPRGHRPMMVSGVMLHSLPAGYQFDLAERHLLPVLPDPGLAERAERYGQKGFARLAGRREARFKRASG